jgi:LacI family transcriptional regulator
MALGVYDELEARALKCGKDISIVGFDDMPFADKFSPPLTTVHTPMISVGTEAARILIDKITNNSIPARTIKLKPELIVRKSTGPVR